MNSLEAYIREQLVNIIPAFDEIEMHGWVKDKSYSLEFYVIRNGERHQCYEIGADEDHVDAALKNIAHYMRTTEDYKNGEKNPINVTITSEK